MRAMTETTNTTADTHALAIHAGHSEWPGDYRDAHAASMRADYYRAYYRALVEEHARRRNDDGRQGGLDAIKMRRRKARRERWLQGVKSLVVVVLNKSEAPS